MTATELNPRPLLDLAVARALQADTLRGEIDQGAATLSPNALDVLMIRQQSVLDTASALATVAEALVSARADERAANPVVVHADLGDEEDAAFDDEDLQPLQAQPLTGLRFTAEFTAECEIISGRAFTFHPRAGWINLTDFDEREDPDGPSTFHVAGRAVSVAFGANQILVITDGGKPLVLPSALVELAADE